MRWFRLYSELIDDPKVQRLPDKLFKTWINLLCLTCKCNGLLPTIEDMAFNLRTNLSDMSDKINDLKDAGLLDNVSGDVLQPHNWNGRQYKSDVSTERVKRFRKQRGNVSETPPDTDTDTEHKKHSARKTRGSESPVFVKAYDRYPRHVGRAGALKAWNKAVARRKNGSTVEQTEDFLFNRVMTYGAACDRLQRDPNFLPHMARWLNDERYLDDPSEWDLKPNGKAAAPPPTPVTSNAAADAELKRQGIL